MRGARTCGAGLAAALFLAGCPGDLESPERFADASAVTDGPGPCPDVPAELLRARCATVGCHESLTHAGNLDLISSNLEARLRGRMASGGPGLIVDPGHPTESILYRKLTATPPFGVRMPNGAAPIEDGTLACVEAWIASLPPLPDMSLSPDLAEPPDLTEFDLAPAPDLSPPRDLATPRDLAVIRDLVAGPDIATVRDLSATPDLLPPPDLAGRDLSAPADLGVPADLSTVRDLAGGGG